MATVTGVNDVINNLNKLRDEVGEEMADSLYAAGEVVRGSAIRSIQEVSAGSQVTRYRNGGNSYQHTASKPGDAPNTDSGDLVKSIAVEAKLDGVYVGSNLDYAAHLEFGTSNMAPRPWLLPAKLKSHKKIVQLIAKGIKKSTAKDYD
jgi:HK97 gp10 family phage protein